MTISSNTRVYKYISIRSYCLACHEANGVARELMETRLCEMKRYYAHNQPDILNQIACLFRIRFEA